MSRIGKYPVIVPEGVTVTINGNVVTAKGKNGELKFAFDDGMVNAKLEENKVVVAPLHQSQQARALWGTTRAQINSIVKGVSEGFTKQLELIGVGYKAEVKGQIIEFSLGFSHDIFFMLPPEVKAEVIQEKKNAPILILKSCDKQLIGQVAAKIRSFRKPEPYKGKGIRFVGEELRRKAGKSANAK